ncbi:MAG TPA: TIGR03619 family F420-dependent LLM class oxidoreductase [Acidimicrobiales bacterium]|nr:TIGR03619 family F420-dependent LLM class oxidoreductase [Acidimicrobiales bacterium]
MKVGVHLPQFGRAAGPDSIRRAAVQAEELGFEDVWVSDHLAVPDGAPYPPAFLYEPVITLTWAGAATSRVGLGSTVLILPYRHPIHLAKELASLDQLSGGRVLLGAGVGWLEGEFDALGVPFHDRGRRTGEYLDAIRACWSDDPASYSGRTVSFGGMKVRPKPAHPIPIWLGGSSERALARAVAKADGWHGNVAPDVAAPIVKMLRSERQDESFTLSMRTSWDGVGTPVADIEREAEAFAGLGIQHVVAVPAQPDLDNWLRSVETVGKVLAPYR